YGGGSTLRARLATVRRFIPNRRAISRSENPIRDQPPHLRPLQRAPHLPHPSARRRDRREPRSRSGRDQPRDEWGHFSPIPVQYWAPGVNAVAALGWTLTEWFRHSGSSFSADWQRTAPLVGAVRCGLPLSFD